MDNYVAQNIGKSVMKLELKFESKEDLEKACWTIWYLYWKLLMQDADKTIFYWRYYQSGYYTKELYEIRAKNYEIFVKFTEKLANISGLGSKMDISTVVSYIIDATVSMAVKKHLGFLEESDASVSTIYQLVFALVFRMLGIESPNN